MAISPARRSGSWRRVYGFCRKAAAGVPPVSRPPACRRSLTLPAPSGGLILRRAQATAWSLNQQGRRPVKFRSSLFKGLQGSRGGSAPRSPVATGEILFRREPFLCFFLFAIQKERRKPSALCRGRHPGRGAAGLLVTNGGSRLELKSPTGRC